MSAQVCNYSIESNSSVDQMVLDCRGCVVETKMKRNSCLERIISSVTCEGDIDSILMKGHYLTRFHGKPVLVIKKIAELRKSIGQMRAKKPGKERRIGSISDLNKKPVDRTCHLCRLYPGTFFSSLDEESGSDLEAFTAALQDAMDELNNHLAGGNSTLNSKHCLKCAGELLKDLTFLFVSYRELARDVTEMGFSVVVHP